MQALLHKGSWPLALRTIASKNCLPTTHKFKQVRMARGHCLGIITEDKSKQRGLKRDTQTDTPPAGCASFYEGKSVELPWGFGKPPFTHVTTYSLGTTRKILLRMGGGEGSLMDSTPNLTKGLQGEGDGDNIYERTLILFAQKWGHSLDN